MNDKFSVLLAAPRGFCAGVERAIATVRLCLERYGRPVYVLHEIVHNRHVLAALEHDGAVFVEDLEQIPRGGVCIFSAHGVSRQVEEKAASLGLRRVDATCPLVTSVHGMVEKHHAMGHEVIIVGHHGHPEVVGTAGRVDGRVHVVATSEEAERLAIAPGAKVAYVTQTTLNGNDIVELIEVLKRRFPSIEGPRDNICFATQHRQEAVRLLAMESELIFVVGSKNSSNSNRLKEVAGQCGVVAHLIDDAGDIDPQWLVGIRRIGITAGASAPERLVDGVLRWLTRHGELEVRTMRGIEEKVHFKPAKLAH